MVRTSVLGAALAASLATSSSAAFAQADPFGALYGGKAGPAAPGSPGSNPSRVGSQGVSTAVGAGYAGSRQTGGAMSLAQIAFLPKTVAPFPVELKTSGGKYLKGRPRIAVPGYALGFARQYKASATAAGRGSDITPRSTKVVTNLIGLDAALEQKLADEAYADLVMRLKAAGFDVVPSAETQAAPHLQSIQRPRTASGHDVAKSWVAFGADEAPLVRGYALDPGLSTSAALIAMGQVSKELDAVVILPSLMIEHLGFETSGHSLYRGSASVDAELGFRLAQSFTPFIWGNERGGSMGGVFTVKGYESPEAFGVMYPLQDRSDDVALHNAFAESGFGSIYRQSLVYGVEVVPERYAALTRAAFQGANQALVDAIVRERAP